MRIHILGIGGTFMGGIARLARELGHLVTGSDMNVYPPMSEQLAALDIVIMEGYDEANIAAAKPDLLIVGNAMARGNPEVEAMLNTNIPFTSGPQWLVDNVLGSRWTLAVAGTHGKTSTASMLAWILDANGLNPGFLIGGVPENFGVSARLGSDPYFVVEADEYDTAFFDKRSKFIHYRPKTLILNNLEFDHADIFETLTDIKKQFHHLVRTVASSGLLIVNAQDSNLRSVLEMGCWTPIEAFTSDQLDHNVNWCERPIPNDGSTFDVLFNGAAAGMVNWRLLGRHNRLNALAAIAAARHAGVGLCQACATLTNYQSVKRRLEHLGTVGGIHVYDDFAHHPTAVSETLSALREAEPGSHIVAVFEPRSNTMRMGCHSAQLGHALAAADQAIVYNPSHLAWDIHGLANNKTKVLDSVSEIIDTLAVELQPGNHVVIMSNGGFEGLHDRLLDRLGKARLT